MRETGGETGLNWLASPFDANHGVTLCCGVTGGDCGIVTFALRSPWDGRWLMHLRDRFDDDGRTLGTLAHRGNTLHHCL